MKTPKSVRAAHDKYMKAILIYVLLVVIWLPYLLSAVVFDFVALQVHTTESMAAAFGWQDTHLNSSFRSAANMRENLSAMGGYMRIVSSTMFETRFIVNFAAVILLLAFFFIVRRFRTDYYSKLDKFLAWRKQRMSAMSRG